MIGALFKKLTNLPTTPLVLEGAGFETNAAPRIGNCTMGAAYSTILSYQTTGTSRVWATEPKILNSDILSKNPPLLRSKSKIYT